VLLSRLPGTFLSSSDSEVMNADLMTNILVRHGPLPHPYSLLAFFFWAAAGRARASSFIPNLYPI
jgi:hypothetical protein